MSKPPTVVELDWQHRLVFRGSSAGRAMTLDGDSLEGPSPVQALALALASCMGADIAYVLTKGRHSLEALHAHLVADRSQTDPHRVVKVTMHFTMRGDFAAAAVDRAIALSREKYARCGTPCARTSRST
jgi:putative redox protein